MPFPVTIGEPHTFDVSFSFVPGSERTTAVARATTGADGGSSVSPADASAGDVEITVRVPGNPDLLGGRWEGTLG